MSSKTHTTVVLNESVQKIKDELSPIYGLKNILSAGLLIFSRLSAEEQKQAIAEVNGQSIGVEKPERVVHRSMTLRDAIKQIVQRTKDKREMPAMTIHISKSDEAAWDELRQIAGVEPAKQKKKKAR